MLCALTLYVGGGIYSLMSTPNDSFLRNFFMAGLFTLRIFARNLLRGSRQRNTVCILLCWLDWDSNPTLPTRLRRLPKSIDRLNFLLELLLFTPQSLAELFMKTFLLSPVRYYLLRSMTAWLVLQIDLLIPM